MRSAPFFTTKSNSTLLKGVFVATAAGLCFVWNEEFAEFSTEMGA
jgi:hypothetical protein